MSIDIQDYFELLNKYSKVRGYEIITLGKVEEFPILLLVGPRYKDRSNLLICSGFHGNEKSWTSRNLILLKICTK